ncbi:MAG: HEAT repeat domain-containing protein [Elusimicrobia bacterium]|nr:HEAT repeat domain-containing protein [Elusimicrobiota bacterium]
MSKQEPSSANLRFIVVWLVAGLFEAPVILLLMGFPLPVEGGWVAAAHVVASALCFFAPPKERGWFRRTRHWAGSLSALCLLLPGVGWALAGASVLLHGRSPFDKDAYRFEDDSVEDSNPLAGLGSEEAIKRELADALDVLPAVDALLSRAPALKRGSIETLARIRTPDAIAWILRARGDRDPDVRFFATTALTRLKRDFETAIHAAEAEVFRRPGDSDSQLSLHRVRYEYSASGMLEAAAKAAILGECREKLEPMAGRSPEAARLLYLVERQLDPARALEQLDRLEAAEPERLVKWTQDRADLLFSLGRHAEVQVLLMLRKKTLGGELEFAFGAHDWRSALLWWTEGKGA